MNRLDNNNDDLYKLIANLHASLLNAPNHETRDALQEDVALKILNTEYTGPFSLTHLLSFIIPLTSENTSKQSYQADESLKFWINLLTHLIEGKHRLFDLSIKSEILKELKANLEDYLTYRTIISEESNSLSTAKKLQSHLIKSLAVKGYAYMRRGYRGSEYYSGHHMPYRITQKGQLLYFYSLNKGNGTENHPILDISPETVNRRSFRNTPVIINYEDFKSTVGLQIIQSDLNLLTVKTQSGQKYTPQDVEGSLQAVGKPSVDFVDGPLSNWVGRNHIANTCSGKGIILVMLDFLITKNVPLEQRKKLIYLGKLLSLVQYYQKLTESERHQTLSHEQIFILFNACKSFDNSIEKVFRDVLTQNDLEISEKVSSLILGWTKARMPELVLKETFVTDEYIIQNNQKAKPEKKEFSASDLEKFQYLKLAFDNLFNESSNEKKFFYEYFLCSIPLPSPVWDRFPEKEIVVIVQKLAGCVANILINESIENLTNYHRKFLAVYSAYAVIDYLLRRKPESKLNGFYAQFWPRHANNFTHPEYFDSELQRYNSIFKYFEKNFHDAKPVFYFSKIIHDPKNLALDYLKQFIDPNYFLPADNQIECMWTGFCVSLPKEYYLYRMISFYCHFLVHAKKGNFPPFGMYAELYQNCNGKMTIPLEFEYYEDKPFEIPKESLSATQTLSKFENPDPELICSLLSDLTAAKSSVLLEKIFLTTPLPRTKSSTVWDQIPIEKVPAVIENLKSSIQIIFWKYNFQESKNFTTKFLVSYSIYAIADYLTRRLSEAKMEGFYSQHWIETKYNLLPVFNIATEAERFNSLADYFMKNANNGSSPLFYFTPSHIHLMNGIRSLNSSNANFNIPDPSVIHLKYLDQFRQELAINLPNEKIQALFEKLWLGTPESNVPESFYSLRFISFHCKMLIRAKYGTCEYVDSKKLFFMPVEGVIQLSYDFPICSNNSSPPTIYDRYHQRLYSSSPLIELHNLYWIKNENDALTKTYENFGSAETPSLRELFRILLCKTTCAATILVWIQHNLEKLSNPYYQNLIEQAFLSNKSLQCNINSSEFIKKAVNVLTDCINYYYQDPVSSKTTLFLFHLAYSFENHRVFDCGNENSFQTLEFIQLLQNSKLHPDLAGKQACLLVCFYDLLNNITQYHLPLLLKFAFTYRSERSLKYWLSDYADQALESISSTIQDYCKKYPDELQQVLDSITEKIFNLRVSSEIKWTGTYPIYTKDSIVIDLSTFEIQTVRGLKISLLPSHLVSTFKFDQNDTQGTWVENVWTSLNQKYKIFKNNLSFQCFQKIQNEYCCLVKSNSVVGLTHAQFFKTHRMWKGEVKTWAIHKETKKIEYCITNNLVVRTDANGYTMPLQFLLLSETNPKIREESVVIYNTDKKCCESIHFPYLGLDFIRSNGQDGFYSKQNDGFYLLTDYTIGNLHGCVHVKSKWEIKVHVPFNYIIPKDNEILPCHKFSNRTFDPKVKSFTYTYLENQKLYHSDLPTANLFLALIFANQRNYVEAMRYLERSEKLDYYNTADWSIFEEIGLDKNRSPEALAFLLKIAILIYKNQHIPCYSQKEYKSRLENFQVELAPFERYVVKFYTIYLESIHSNASNQIPQYIKLSLSEEYFLITHLKANQGNKDWNYVLETRFNLLTAPNYTLYRKSLPHTVISTRPWIENLDKIILELKDSWKYNEHFFLNTSFTEGSLGAARFSHLTSQSIINLIDCAKTAIPDKPHPIDIQIFYLQCESSESIAFIAALLLCIRKDPKEFIKFNFTKSGKENYQTFLDIVQHADKVKKQTSFFSGFGKGIIDKISGGLEISIDLKAIKQLKEVKSIPSPLNLQFIDKRIVEEIQNPLKKYRQYFKKPLSLQYQDDGFGKFLKFLKDKDSSKLENAIRHEIKDGHKKNLNTPIFTHQLGDKPIETIILELRDDQKEYKTELQKLRKIIVEKANEVVIKGDLKLNEIEILTEIKRKLRRDGGQTLTLTLENSLIEAFLLKDASLITRHNELSTTQMQNVITNIIEYVRYQIQYTFTENALKALDKGSIQEFGDLCHWQSSLDPFEFPEIPVFIFQSGIVPRMNQIAILDWLMKAPYEKGKFDKFMLAFEAGGGKTSILQTILMAYARRLGLLPISISTDALFSIDKANQKKFLLDAFNQHLNIIESSLHVHLNEGEVRNIEIHLLTLIEEKKHLKITPQTFYNLYLLLLKSLDQQHDKLIDPLCTILFDVFEQKGYALLDEVRHNALATDTAKIGLGAPIQLEPYEIELIEDIFKMMIGFSKDPIYNEEGKSLSTILDLANKERIILNSEWNSHKHIIAKHLLKYLPKPSSKIDEEQFKAFWTDLSTPVPTLLQNLLKTSPQKAEQLVLIRGLLCSIIPNALALKYKFGYNPSIKSGEEFYTPSKRTDPTTASYEDAYMTLFITMRGYFQKGLSKKKVIKFIYKLHSEMLSDYKSGKAYTETQAHELWMKITGGKFDALHKYHPDPVNPDIELINMIKHNPDAIFWYMSKIVTPTITFSEYQYEITPTHLLNAFRNLITFSAYPGLKELYAFHPGNSIEKVQRTDTPFIASAVKKMLEHQNNRMIVFPNTDLGASLQHLVQNERDVFNNLCAFIDVGGMFSNTSTEEFARAFLKLSEDNALGYDCFVFFKTKKSSDHTEAPAYILRSSGGVPESLPTTDLIESLRLLGLKWENLKIASLYDPKKTSGTHLLQPDNGTALLLLDHNVPFGELIQAALRMRKFLTTQRIIWGMSAETKDAISKIMNVFDLLPKTIIRWSIKNEMMSTEGGIIPRLYHEIEYHIQLPSIAKIKALKGRSVENCIQFQKHRQGFAKPGKLKPSERFLEPSKQEPTRDVLLKYAKNYYEKFKYDVAFEKSPAYPYVLGIINDITGLIGLLDNTPKTQQTGTSKTYKYEQQVESVQRKVHTRTLGLDCVDSIPLTDYLQPLNNPKFLTNLLQYSKSANQFFECRAFNSSLYYTRNATRVIEKKSDGSYVKLFKPAPFFLCVKDNKNNVYTFGLADIEVEHYFKELFISPTVQVPHQVMIIYPNGSIYQNPNNLYRFKDAERILNSDEMKQTICQFSLINGDLNDPSQLIKFVSKTPDFEAIWENIKKLHVNPDVINKFGIEGLAFGKKGFKS